MTVRRAARPGVFAEPFDSSLTVRQVSQPQKAKIDPDSPAMNADSVRPAGLNQSQLNAAAVSDDPDFAIATAAKTSSTISWNPTRMNWTFSVVVMPRYATRVAIARNPMQVRTLIPRFSQRAPSASLWKRSPRNW